jgi:phage head maturation protease
MQVCYAPINKVDAEQRLVFGYASTPDVDSDGETVTKEAVAGALDSYMRWANLREMHQNSAVGKIEEATLDDKGLYVVAKVVDDTAWRKVTAGVYNGFSIGGRATKRDPADRKRILALTLSEISLVDRPSCPSAIFDCYKRAAFLTSEDFALAMTKSALRKPWAEDRGVLAFLSHRDRGF